MPKRLVYIGSTVKREHGLCCPRCGSGAEGAVSLTFNPLPQPPTYEKGQLSLCPYCGAINVYDKPLLRTLKRSERRERMRKLDPEVRRLLEESMRLFELKRQEKRREVN